MSETLVIRLRAAEEAPASWLIVDSTGARSGPVQAGPLADALAVAEARRVVVLVPGSEVTLAEPELPVRSGARLAQVVPYALEEQLASDVDTLHFAVGRHEAGSVGTPVAVVSRVVMDQWHAALSAAGLQPGAMYSDASVVPPMAGGCTLLLDESVLYVRRPDGLPCVIDAEPLAGALEIALETPEAAGESGEHVTFYTTPADYERHRELIEGALRSRTASLQVKLLPEGPLPLLATQAAGEAGINLLQGPYVARSSLGTQLQRWRLPAALAAATALLFLTGQAVSLWQLSRAEKSLDGEIAQVFSQALPGQPMVDARAQMQGVLGTQAAAGTGLLPAVSALAQAMAQAPSARIEAMSYRGNALELRLTAPTVESLDGIKQAMTRGGVTAELQSATPRGNVVEGRLQVRLASA
jgi:general secretion pathway protein L